MIQLKKKETLVVRSLRCKTKISWIEGYCISCCEFDYDSTEQDSNVRDLFFEFPNYLTKERRDILSLML